MAETAKDAKKDSKISPELAKKVDDAHKRLDSKPDAPRKDEKKSDVAIPMDALPKDVETELKAFIRSTSKGDKAFDVMVTNYLASQTDAYGISKDSGKLVNGLEKEMVKAYALTLGLSDELVKDLESTLKLGGGKENGPGAALARDFRNLTGFNYELKEGLLEQKTLSYQEVKDTVLKGAYKSLFGYLRADSLTRFTSAVTNENWKDFKSVPLTMAKKLGLEDQIDDSRIAHRTDVVNLYGQLFSDYANRFRTKYLN